MTRRKTVCKIQYEDSNRRLHSTTIRLRANAPLNSDNLRKLLRAQGRDVSFIFGETCTFYPMPKGRQVHLPHMRKKR